ncbi:hypothetical protein XthCFBP4691_16595 [Xanthomonas theicola]|uniref:Uncharacterized protein n=1 Tax=Xanthomonas theicola TaxID=56464 RepID=A0A2S6ZBJ4_9XANT|nr:hypothetical protein XthCFBP4691_16595 [Xanthomonas theicola]
MGARLGLTDLVVDVDSRKNDHAFFDALNRQLDNGGRAAFLHDMLARDSRREFRCRSSPSRRVMPRARALRRSSFGLSFSRPTPNSAPM